MFRKALLAALLLAVGWGGVQSLRLAGVKAENSRLTRSNTALVTQAERSDLARGVDAARAELEMERAREATAAVELLLTADLGECADAPLDPAITNILNGLHGRD
jgi:hypothetical protein